MVSKCAALGARRFNRILAQRVYKMRLEAVAEGILPAAFTNLPHKSVRNIDIHDLLSLLR